ncbi:hypothetical protein B0H13DRAFT_2015390 [Mycena leptocephala]|nr:hypothetical protein B0H13DRAFT_2015390 [Mycena leptocephala]
MQGNFWNISRWRRMYTVTAAAAFIATQHPGSRGGKNAPCGEVRTHRGPPNVSRSADDGKVRTEHWQHFARSHTERRGIYRPLHRSGAGVAASEIRRAQWWPRSPVWDVQLDRWSISLISPRMSYAGSMQTSFLCYRHARVGQPRTISFRGPPLHLRKLCLKQSSRLVHRPRRPLPRSCDWARWEAIQL